MKNASRFSQAGILLSYNNVGSFIVENCEHLWGVNGECSRKNHKTLKKKVGMKLCSTQEEK